MKSAKQFRQCFCYEAAVCELKVLFLQLLLSSLSRKAGGEENENPDSLIKNMAFFGLNFKKRIETEKLFVICIRLKLSQTRTTGNKF